MHPELRLDAIRMKLAITQAIRSFHGEVGAAMRVELIHHEEGKQEAVLQVAERCLTRVWSALTVMTHFDEKQCTVDVLQVYCNPDELTELGLNVESKALIVQGQPPLNPGPAEAGENVDKRTLAGPVGSEFVSLT